MVVSNSAATSDGAAGRFSAHHRLMAAICARASGESSTRNDTAIGGALPRVR
jgi:hypothetical protein